MTPEQQPSETDYLTIEQEYVRASTGKRFANYLIDILAFYMVAFIIGIILAILSPAAIDSLNDNSPGIDLISRLFALAFYGLYMGVVEALFKGKSLGKLITKTRAVNLDGSRISVFTAFARGFSRAVPFCVFSAFGNPCNPWQDSWTNTMVIDENNLYSSMR